MRAAVFHGRGDVRVERVEDPAPGAGELLLRVHASGICGTDAHEYAHGPSMFPIDRRDPVTRHLGPMIPGHEPAGTVVALGHGVDGFALDEFVVCGAGIACGTCVHCRRGRTNLCVRYATVGLQRHGALAQFCAVPAATCHPVAPHELSRDAAVLAQPMAIAAHAVRRGGLGAADHAVVVGAGGIGAFLTHAAVAAGARVAVLDLDRGRLDLATRLGAQAAVVPDGDLPVRRRLALEPGSPTIVFEVTGRPAGLATALDLLPGGGRLVVVGLQGRPVEVDLRDIVLREIELIGTNAHVCDVDLPYALALLAARDAPWDDVAPVALALDDLVTGGLEPLASGRSRHIKTLVDPWASHTRATSM
jgi:(R,R)-butanediol dehydrogenase/meso-butanediol dehydrogenase/diacetyl reductase